MTATVAAGEANKQSSAGLLQPDGHSAASLAESIITTADKKEKRKSTPGKTVTINLELNAASNDAQDDDQQDGTDPEMLVIPTLFTIDALVPPKCELPKREKYEPVENFVATAVKEQHEKFGSDADENLPQYKGLLETLRKKADHKMLHRVLLALRTSGQGSTLRYLTTGKHARLMHLISRLNPFELPVTGKIEAVADSKVADAHFHLLRAIVSSNSVYLMPTLRALWRMVTFEEFMPEHNDRIQRVHATMATIFKLCPRGKQDFFTVMSSSAPFSTKPKAAMFSYYVQCMQVLVYHSELRNDLVELLVEKCLELDVEIRIDDGGDAMLDDDEEDVFDDANVNVFAIDVLDSQGGNKIVFNPHVKPGSVDDTADKLDMLMYMLFDVVQSSVEKDQDAALASLYQTLSRLFDSSIFATHKAKFVQFVIFNLCGLEMRLKSNSKTIHSEIVEEETLYRTFAAHLIKIIVDPYRATVSRQIAACYLASFVSRAKYVCSETACESVSALLRWCEAYMSTVGPNSYRAADPKEQALLYSLFYTISQAAFYIMCFRGPEAVDFYQKSLEHSQNVHVDSDLYPDPVHVDVSAARWNYLCSHALQPLRFCLESVKLEFLGICRSYSLLDVCVLQSILNAEERHQAAQARKKKATAINTAATVEQERVSGGVGGLGQGTNPLDSFFPFDPYLLKHSYRFVEPFYRHWEALLPDDIVLSDDDDNDGMIEDHEDGFAVQDGHDRSNDYDAINVDGMSQVDHDDESVNTSIGDEKSELDDASSSYGNNDDDDTAEPMSLASRQGEMFMDDFGEDRSILTPEVMPKRDALRAVWTETLKRTRVPSLENGSW